MFNFIEQQILRMDWLNDLVEWFLNLFGVDCSTQLGASLQFFIYDSIKIFILLLTLIFFISYIQSYFPPERTKKILSRFKGIHANILSALLGTITPFCSCSSIPLFIGFTSSGLPLGVTMSFLISSPMVDLGSLLLLTSIFGWQIAVVYVLFGLILAVVGGTLLDMMGMEKYVEPFIKDIPAVETEEVTLTRKDRFIYAKQQAVSIFKKVFIYVLIGVGIGSLIHNVIPESFIQQTLGSGNPFSVFIATAVGVPMYADIFGTIPIAEALYAKGVGLGTVLALMMSVTALSLPAMIMLKQVIKPKLLFAFIAIVSTGIILIGLSFNAFQYLF